MFRSDLNRQMKLDYTRTQSLSSKLISNLLRLQSYVRDEQRPKNLSEKQLSTKYRQVSTGDNILKWFRRHSIIFNFYLHQRLSVGMEDFSKLMQGSLPVEAKNLLSTTRKVNHSQTRFLKQDFYASVWLGITY